MPSFFTAILGFALAAQTQAHVSIISIYGSNNHVGHAFGVNLNGRYPRVKGAPGDAGGDSGIYQTGTNNPSPACGSTPELGPLDVPAWLDQAEGSGLPAAYPNMSVVMEVFQVNRDGGGPMGCEYSDDATATSWQPMFMTLNQAGNSGIENQQRVNSTVVANFPKNATCNGGFTQTACIVRCLTGVNRRFGGCFAVKLSDSETYASTVSTNGNSNATSVSRMALDSGSETAGALSDQDIDKIAQKIMSEMESRGFLVSAAAAASLNSTLPILNGRNGSMQSSQLDSVVFRPNSSATFDASDAADAATASDTSDAVDPSIAAAAVAVASKTSNITDASDVADAVFYHTSNQTDHITAVRNTLATVGTDNASITDKANQPLTDSTTSSNRHRRHSCSSHRRRQKNTLAKSSKH